LDFALRRFLNRPLRPYREPIEPKNDLFAENADAQAAEHRLLARYDLNALRQYSSRLRYLETLTYLHWLDYFHSQAPEVFQAAWISFQSNSHAPDAARAPEPLRWLDVGAKNWAYAAAIPAFLAAQGVQAIRMDGVELDPHRRYADLQTRGQAAQAHIRDLPQAAYHEGDILAWQASAHIISHFLPFVFSDPHLAWGLPLGYFQPQAVLTHLLTLLPPQGVLIIVNQGPAEAEAQEALLKAAQATTLEGAAPRVSIGYQNIGQLPSPFIEYRYPRYGWICWKQTV
jgi:hypothetical protein